MENAGFGDSLVAIANMQLDQSIDSERPLYDPVRQMQKQLRGEEYPFPHHDSEQRQTTILINGLFQQLKAAESDGLAVPPLFNHDPYETYLPAVYTPEDFRLETVLAATVIKNLPQLQEEFYDHFIEQGIPRVMRTQPLTIPHDHRTYVNIMETSYLLFTAANRYAHESGDTDFLDIRKNILAPIGPSVRTFGVDFEAMGFDRQSLEQLGLESGYSLGELARSYGNLIVTYPPKAETDMKELAAYRSMVVRRFIRSFRVKDAHEDNGLYPVKLIAVEGSRTKADDNGTHRLGEINQSTQAFIQGREQAVMNVSLDDIGIYDEKGLHPVNVGMAAGEVLQNISARGVIADLQKRMDEATERRQMLDAA